MSHESKDFKIVIRQWTRALIEGINYLDKFLDRQENFLGRTDLKYIVFETITKNFSGYITKIFSKISADDFDEIVRSEFEKNLNTVAPMTFLFNIMIRFNLKLVNKKKKKKS